MNRYSYQELRDKAENGTIEDINALGEWFERYGNRFWNGEYYDADGRNLYEVLKQIGEDSYEIVGYEWR